MGVASAVLLLALLALTTLGQEGEVTRDHWWRAFVQANKEDMVQRELQAARTVTEMLR